MLEAPLAFAYKMSLKEMWPPRKALKMTTKKQNDKKKEMEKTNTLKKTMKETQNNYKETQNHNHRQPIV